MSQPPRILLVETSGSAGRVGLARGDELISRRALDPARRHARDLAPAVKDLLAEVDWRPREVTAVFASRGPGSYTGLRVGLMAAKAFAYAARCDLLAVDTFAAIAAACPPSHSTVEVVADALRGLIYAQRFARGAATAWEQVNDLAILPKGAWLTRLTSGTLVTGPGLSVVEGDLPLDTPVGPAAARDADLAGLLAVGLARYERGEHSDIWSCEPLYLRRSSAEETWERKNSPPPGTAAP